MNSVSLVADTALIAAVNVTQSVTYSSGLAVVPTCTYYVHVTDMCSIGYGYSLNAC